MSFILTTHSDEIRSISDILKIFQIKIKILNVVKPLQSGQLVYRGK